MEERHILFMHTYQEYIIEREGEYPTPVYPSVVSLDRGHDLYTVIHRCGISLFVQSNRNMASQRAWSKTTTTWPAMICMNNIIKVMSPIKAYYNVVYWSRTLSLPLYYIPLHLYTAHFDGEIRRNLLQHDHCVIHFR